MSSGALWTDDAAATGLGRLAPGTAVEVANRYTGGWSSGFFVVASTPDAYRLRRSSDLAELPALFTAAEIRAARPVA